MATKMPLCQLQAALAGEIPAGTIRLPCLVSSHKSYSIYASLAGLERCCYSFDMASLAFHLSAMVLLAQSSAAFNCSIPPIYVDIHKRVTHLTNNFQYGSFIGVGTPAQNHSLWPSLSRNQTSFGANTFCDGNSALKDCENSTGGFFNSRDSTTYVYIVHHTL